MSAGPEAVAPVEGTVEGEAEGAVEGGFHVRLDNFEGPFDLLLQLIAKHRLDVTEVALSRVTDEFIAHVKALGEGFDLDLTSHFVLVAATLLDLKTARLLPAAEVEDTEDLALLEARDLLFARLLQYRAFKEIAGRLGETMAEQATRWPRPGGLEERFVGLLPPADFPGGPESLARAAAAALAPRPVDEVGLAHLHASRVNVRDEARVVSERLRAAGSATFADLVADSPDTLTTVCRFLALLELFRERAIALDQPDPLGTLTVRWTGGDAELTISDEFDGAPAPPAPPAAPVSTPAEDGSPRD